MYLVRVKFLLNHKRRDVLIELPYVVDNIFVYISGVAYQIVDVLSDKNISPGINGIFIRFFKNKINISSLRQSLRMNGAIVEAQVPHTEPLNPRKARAAPRVPVLWYMISRWGLQETFRLLHGNKLIILHEDDKRVKKYQEDEEYQIFTTGYDSVLSNTQVKSKGKTVRRNTATNRYIRRYIWMNGGTAADRVHCPLVLITKKSDDPLVIQTMGSLFYVLDLFPEILPKDLLGDEETINYIMGMLIFKENKTRPDYNDMMKRLFDKLMTLEDHVDDFMLSVLHDEFADTLGEDFSKDGFYKVLKAVYIRYARWRTSANWIVANILDKRYKILDFITVPLFNKFNTFNFQLKSRCQSYQQRIPDPSSVASMMKNLTTGMMYAIRSGTPGCTLTTYGGDNIYMKYTSDIHLQFNAPCSTGNKKSDAGGKPDPVTLINETHAHAGTMHAISKRRSTCITHLNMFAPYDPETSTIIPDEDNIAATDKLSRILRQMPTRSSKVGVPPEFIRYKRNRRKKNGDKRNHRSAK
jgi:hypothetical protein